MDMDNETWLIEIGDEIIEKKASLGYESLNKLEQSIYCFWVIDYAVRNSGSLEPIDEIYPSAMDELKNNAHSNKWSHLLKLLATSLDQESFCNDYYELFESACSDVRSAYENT